jgi:hypothetical protein
MVVVIVVVGHESKIGDGTQRNNNNPPKLPLLLLSDPNKTTTEEKEGEHVCVCVSCPIKHPSKHMYEASHTERERETNIDPDIQTNNKVQQQTRSVTPSTKKQYIQA